MKQPFNLIKSPLQGTNLIEAGAGTGKTYTISGIYLRLLLENHLNVDQILVVTFTEAATAELKDRILTLLRQAYSAFAGGVCTEPFLKPLVDHHPDRKTAIFRLETAIRSFDQAAIFTIHGFCLRVLQEHPFESGNTFNAELSMNQDAFYQEIADDFWRQSVYDGSPFFNLYLMQQNILPDTLRPAFQRYLSVPDIRLTPEVTVPDSSDLERQCRDSFVKITSSWPQVRSEVAEILQTDPGLNRNRYKTSLIPGLMESMDEFSRSTAFAPVLFPGFEKFTAGFIRGAVKKGYPPPCHPFFDLCFDLQKQQEHLDEIHHQKLIRLKTDFFHYLHKESAKRKKQKNFRSFDDLLLDCRHALADRNSAADLVESLRKQYAAALIDEFQDTDPVQYTIFQTIFGDPSCSILFLIGDPKQAIYSFRGADIFAYMNAAAQISRQYTLSTNWRSEKRLVHAVNTVFGNVNNPFAFHDIQYHDADASPDRKNNIRMEINGLETAPFQLWYLESTDGKPVSKSLATRLITDAVAAEISRLLNQTQVRISIEGKPAAAGDIAVLVRKNREASLVQNALSAYGIPSVIFSSASIFDSFEAFEMERLLSAVVFPGREDKIRSALTTEMLGCNAQDLMEILTHEDQYEKRYSSFVDHHFIWEKHGFLRMFSRLYRSEKIQERLMQYHDGERRITNIRHLTELIHQAGLTEKKGMGELLEWFQGQRQPGRERLDEHQLRLESDENAVKLITIHKSKGLEYPVVFCPFTWEGSKIKPSADLIAYHDDIGRRGLTLDLGSENRDDSLRCAEKEALSENLRLLYVALTRAKYICYMVWGRFSYAESSAPGYLFHFPEPGPESGSTRDMKAIDDQTLLSDLYRLSKRSDKCLHVGKMPQEPGSFYLPPENSRRDLSCRHFTTRIRNGRTLSSFSSLVHSHHENMNLSEYLQKGEEDAPDSIVPDIQPSKNQWMDIFLFPRGALPGTCLHDILEHLDFSNQDPDLVRSLIHEKLVQYGFHPNWTDTLYHMLIRLLNTPLDEKDPDFMLSRLRAENRANELEFCYPVHALTAKKLETVFRTHPGPPISKEFTDRIGKLGFGRVDGFMKGFVDLIFQYQNRFYIVDWKSNYLGNENEHYSHAALQTVMENDLYILQYHIYSVALDRYLKQRLTGYDYERHFGGVFYLFLRGFGSDSRPQAGIFRDRPSEHLIRAISDLIGDPGRSDHE
ncbi:MAG: exodeoxyribonuclease V subunit beta [Pseudomonadota bacterium]